MTKRILPPAPLPTLLVQRRDFHALLLGLRSRGYTLDAIADAMGCSRSNPRNWIEGKEPGHHAGEMLIALHNHVFSQTGTSRPPAALNGDSLSEAHQ